jgi:hypothetical protein
VDNNVQMAGGHPSKVIAGDKENQPTVKNYRVSREQLKLIWDRVISMTEKEASEWFVDFKKFNSQKIAWSLFWMNGVKSPKTTIINHCYNDLYMKRSDTKGVSVEAIAEILMRASKFENGKGVPDWNAGAEAFKPAGEIRRGESLVENSLDNFII